MFKFSSHLHLRSSIINHPVYESLGSLRELRVFMEHHVIAVWDFMTLLKALQRQLTCVSIPWVPSAHPRLRRMINEIVIAEESDLFAGYPAQSHFEFYLAAMDEAGADWRPMAQVITSLQQGKPFAETLANSSLPLAAQHFANETYSLVASQQWHAIAAVFAYAREGLIPAMFTQIVAQLNEQFPGSLERLKAYLDHHIILDGEVHGHLADEMVAELCGNDPIKWGEAEAAVHRALGQRAALWDSVIEAHSLATC